MLRSDLTYEKKTYIKMTYSSSLNAQEWEMIETLLPKKKKRSPPTWTRLILIDSQAVKNTCNMERCKSLVKNFERTLTNANAKIHLCFVRLMLKRLAIA